METIEVVRIDITTGEVVGDETREVAQSALDDAKSMIDTSVKFDVGGVEYAEIKRAYSLEDGWYVKMEELL